MPELISSFQTRLVAIYLILNQDTHFEGNRRIIEKKVLIGFIRFRISYGCIYAVDAQFRRTTCKYERVIGQQYTRGIWIITAVSTTTRSFRAGFFDTIRSSRATSKLFLNSGPADVKMRAWVIVGSTHKNSGLWNKMEICFDRET